MQIEELRQAVAVLKVRRPELATRADRAAAILATREVKGIGIPGMWWVESQSKPGLRHLVTMNGERTCDCYDFESGRAPAGWCKHLIAMATLLRAEGKELERRGQVFSHLVEKGIPTMAALEMAKA